MSLKCKQCGSSSYVKNGFIKSSQRYKCKECGINFIIECDKRVKYGIQDLEKDLVYYLLLVSDDLHLVIPEMRR